MATNVESLQWQVSGLSPLTINGIRLDERDLQSPNAKELRKIIKSLYEQVLNDKASTEFLRELGKEEIDFTIDVCSEKQEIRLFVKRRMLAWDNPFIKPHRVNVTFNEGIQKLIQQASAQMGTKGASVEKSHTVKALEEANHPWIASFVKGIDKCNKTWLGKIFFDSINNVGASFADTLSIVRNTGLASATLAGRAFVAYDILLKVGGFLGIIVGSWFCLKSLFHSLIALSLGDWKGAGIHFCSAMGTLCYALFGLLMLGMILSMDKIVGFGLYTFLFIGSVLQLIREALFRRELNQKLKNNQVEEAIIWLQTQAQNNKTLFEAALKSSESAMLRIKKEVDEDFIQKLNDKEPETVAQAIYLIEEVSKANLSNMYSNVLYMAISVLGVISVYFDGLDVVVSALFFAIGAVVWLLSGDGKLEHFAQWSLKGKVVNWLWEKGDSQKFFDDLKRNKNVSKWFQPDSQSKSSSRTSYPSVGLAQIPPPLTA